MRRSVRLLVIGLGLSMVLSGLLVAPAAAHEPGSTPLGASCSDYVTTLRVVTGAGNVYESKTNVCLATVNGTSGSGLLYEAVERKICLRNGASYGDGTGGCRWSDYLEHQVEPAWGPVGNELWCYTCGGTFVSNSGRQYTNDHYNPPAGKAMRAHAFGRQVAIYFADGTQKTYNETGVLSKTMFATA